MTGSGTQEDPYIIYDVTDLQNVQNDLDAYYELANDIDASAASGWNGGAGFVPIATFTGHFDGKDYTISDLYINRSTSDYQALFGQTSGATIGNLHLKDCFVAGDTYIGILVGYSNTGSIDEIHVTDSMSEGEQNVGGLVGYHEHGSIQDSDFQGTIGQVWRNWQGRRIGGLCGYAGWSTIKYCFTNINIYTSSLSEEVGGFIGSIYVDCNIDECYSKGNMYIWFYQYGGYQWRAGGFAGFIANGATVDNCYSRTIVAVQNTGSRIGGFSGQNVGTGGNHIDNCYSTGFVNGSSNVGGFNGYTGASTITDCFWDTETSGQPTSVGGTGKTTAEMTTTSTFTDAGWNFTTIWDRSDDYNNGYPILLMLPTQGSLGGYLWIEGTKLAYTDAYNRKRTIQGTLDGATGQTPGYGWVEGNNFRYIDASGDERYLTGTLDGATGKTAGHLWIESTKLRYIDASGDERWFQGT